MGFSVSGAFAILVVASFVAFGMAYSATANGFERVSDARSAAAEHALDRQNTAIEIAQVTYSSGTLDVNVTNSGTTPLDVNATDVLVDGVYQTDSTIQWARVVGDPTSHLWLPGETLFVRVQIAGSTKPARVKVVTEYGVADEGVVP